VAAHCVLPRAVDLVTTMAAAQIVPNAVFDWSSQLPASRCCDDQLSSPSVPAGCEYKAAGSLPLAGITDTLLIHVNARASRQR
ncbi:MAG: hypothetical protein P4M09_19150, partial [Devosia sp.]|nr:hypothetical protein [Devosia sp.]